MIPPPPLSFNGQYEQYQVKPQLNKQVLLNPIYSSFLFIYLFIYFGLYNLLMFRLVLINMGTCFFFCFFFFFFWGGRDFQNYSKNLYSSFSYHVILPN